MMSDSLKRYRRALAGLICAAIALQPVFAAAALSIQPVPQIDYGVSADPEAPQTLILRPEDQKAAKVQKTVFPLAVVAIPFGISVGSSLIQNKGGPLTCRQWGNAIGSGLGSLGGTFGGIGGGLIGEQIGGMLDCDHVAQSRGRGRRRARSRDRRSSVPARLDSDLTAYVGRPAILRDGEKPFAWTPALPAPPDARGGYISDSAAFTDHPETTVKGKTDKLIPNPAAAARADIAGLTVDNPRVIESIRGSVDGEKEIGKLNWHEIEGGRYFHVFDGADDWYGFQVRREYFVARWKNGRLLWQDPEWKRWCYWDKGYRWSDGPDGSAYLYERGVYYRFSTLKDGTIVLQPTLFSAPTPPQIAASIDPEDKFYYNKEATRVVLRASSGQVLLYDRTKQGGDGYDAFLGRLAKESDDVQFLNDPRGPRIVVVGQDAESAMIFDLNGKRLAADGASAAPNAVVAVPSRAPQAHKAHARRRRPRPLATTASYNALDDLKANLSRMFGGR